MEIRMMTIKETQTSLARRLVTIRQQSERCPAFTESSLRSLIFHSKANGLEAAVVRIGRRVLIDTDEFDRWLGRQRKV
jgi:hypothetical protein